jgi:hypothetical protein
MRRVNLQRLVLVAALAMALAVPASGSQFDATWSLTLTSVSSTCPSAHKSAVTKVTIQGNAVSPDGGAQGALVGNKLSMSRISNAGNKQTYEAEFKSPTQAVGTFSSQASKPCTGEFTLTRQ